MTNFLRLPTWDDDGHIHTVVETPRGSTCKLDFDPDLGVFTLAKPLMAGLSYPFDWGFIPSTKAPDGDPLDVLIIHDARTYPGVVLKCRPVGVLEVEQTSGAKKERNDRIFAVPDRSPLETDLKDKALCATADSLAALVPWKRSLRTSARPNLPASARQSRTSSRSFTTPTPMLNRAVLKNGVAFRKPAAGN